MLPFFRVGLDVIFGGFVAVGLRIILAGPVDEGEVEAEFYVALLADCIGKRTDDVAFSRRGLDRADIARFCVPESEAVMVFRRDDGVFGAALLDELGSVFRVIVGGCKGIGLLHVVGKRDVAVVEGPAF